jgi:hypothetical protein
LLIQELELDQERRERGRKAMRGRVLFVLEEG